MLCEVPIPDGYEFVAIRSTKPGDLYLYSLHGKICISSCGLSAQHLVVVVRKKWTPPSFLKAGWIQMDAHGNWRWFEKVPFSANGECGYLDLGLVNWNPPAVSDWRESLIRIDDCARSN